MSSGATWVTRLLATTHTHKPTLCPELRTVLNILAKGGRCNKSERTNLGWLKKWIIVKATTRKLKNPTASCYLDIFNLLDIVGNLRHFLSLSSTNGDQWSEGEWCGNHFNPPYVERTNGRTWKLFSESSKQNKPNMQHWVLQYNWSTSRTIIQFRSFCCGQRRHFWSAGQDWCLHQWV